MGTTNFGTCGLGCNSLPSYVQTEQSPSPVAREALHIRGPRPIPVTEAFVKFFLNGKNRGMGDANGKRRLLALQPAVERNVAGSRSNLDFYSIVRTCLSRTSGFSSCLCLRSALQCLETSRRPYTSLAVKVTECGLQYCARQVFLHKQKFKYTE